MSPPRLDAAQWEQVRSLFHEAIDIAPAELPAWLLANCPDPGLRTELSGLLESASSHTGMLTGTALAGTGEALKSILRFQDGSLVQQRLGHYTLVREVGRGGMGIVFEAERQDGEIRQTVAIKVLTAPLIDREAIRQFDRERQALNAFDHPNIARLLDWGQTPDGHPYLVIEFVREAKTIVQYCRALDTRQTLNVFLVVADAITHAHRHLVVHRDLKPANVLVTAAGQVKVLDFGIAKLLDESVPEANPTVTAFRRLTPAYASPEQLLGAPVTTATDVYSLGLLLHEMLTGSLPANTQTGRRKQLPRDIDKILSKALEPDTARRYSSVEAFSNDIRNHLAGRPVEAQGITWSYQAGAFIRRNAISVTAALIALLSLLGGTGVAVWKARVANQQREIAVKHFRELRELSHSLIFETYDSVANLPGATSARRAVISNALRYLDALRQETNGDDALQLEVGAGYSRLGDLQGGAFRASLGDRDGAIGSDRQAIQILQRRWSKSPFDPACGEPLFRAYSNLVSLLPDPAQAEASLTAPLALATAWVQARPREIRAVWALVDLYEARGRSRTLTGQLKDSLDDFAHAESLIQNARLLNPSDWRAEWHMETTWAERATDLELQGNAPAAYAVYQDVRANALASASRWPAIEAFHRTRRVVLGRESQLLLAMNRPADALESIRASVADSAALAAKDPLDLNAQRDLALARCRYGRILLATQRHSEGVAELQQAAAIYSKLPVTDPWLEVFHARCLNDLATALHSRDIFQRALDLADRGLRETPSKLPLLRERERAAAQLNSPAPYNPTATPHSTPATPLVR